MPCGTISTGEQTSDIISFETVWSNSNGEGDSYGVQTLPTSYSFKRTSGECIPNFHKRKREGELLPATNFSQYEMVGRIKPGIADTRTDGDGWWIRNITSNYPYPGDWKLTEDDLLAHVDYDAPNVYVQGAAAEIYSGGHDMLTFLAELRKTGKMFVNLAGYFRKGRTPKPDEIFGVWLEGRYGLRVLLYDLLDLKAAVENMESVRTRFSERTGSTTKSLNVNIEEGLGAGAVTYDMRHTDEISVSTRGHVVADMEPPTFQFNPIVTGYELLKWSYIVDWVVGVGTWLEAMSFLIFAKDYQADGGQLVTIKRTSDVAAVNPLPGSPGITYSGSVQVAAECEAKYTWRKPMRVPMEPQRGSGLDDLKIMDIVSLMRQAKLKPQRKGVGRRRFKTRRYGSFGTDTFVP